MYFLHNRSGFSIVGVMAATILLGTVLFAFSDSFTSSMRALFKGRDKSCQIHLLQQRAEEIKAMEYNSISTGSTQIANYGGTRWTLEQIVDETHPGLKKITLVMKDGNEAEEELLLLIYKDGI